LAAYKVKSIRTIYRPAEPARRRFANTKSEASAGDPDQPLLMPMEDFETKRATKTAVFQRRTLERSLRCARVVRRPDPLTVQPVRRLAD
jgi:hypothetical protein